jgi:dTDP-4-amino-4,6-dideoxygalactose transaminase
MGISYNGSRLGSFGEAEVFSLHATKLINGFEGGYVTTNNDDLAGILRWQRNFAIPAGKPTVKIPCSHVLGMNAKLNELHAAMALLSLSGIDETIQRNRERYEAYRHSLRGFQGINLVPYPDPAVEESNYRMAVIEIDETWPLSRDEMCVLLRAEGAAISSYYSPPLHQSDLSPQQAEPLSLSVTEMLADRYLQLPVGELVSSKDIRALGKMFHFISKNAQTILRRLESDKVAMAQPAAGEVK